MKNKNNLNFFEWWRHNLEIFRMDIYKDKEF